MKYFLKDQFVCSLAAVIEGVRPGDLAYAGKSCRFPPIQAKITRWPTSKTMKSSGRGRHDRT